MGQGNRWLRPVLAALIALLLLVLLLTLIDRYGHARAGDAYAAVAIALLAAAVAA